MSNTGVIQGTLKQCFLKISESLDLQSILRGYSEVILHVFLHIYKAV